MSTDNLGTENRTTPGAGTEAGFVVGTRGSALAVTQTTTVAEALAAESGLPYELVRVKTEGDVTSGPLSQLGGTGVFAAALRIALLEGDCDVAIHSLKDLPSRQPPGLVIAATPRRVDVRDALCARDGLPWTPCRPAPRSAPGPRAAPRSCAPPVRTWRSWTSAATWAPASAGSRARRPRTTAAWAAAPRATWTPLCWPPPDCSGWACRTTSPSTWTPP